MEGVESGERDSERAAAAPARAAPRARRARYGLRKTNYCGHAVTFMVKYIDIITIL